MRSTRFIRFTRPSFPRKTAVAAVVSASFAAAALSGGAAAAVTPGPTGPLTVAQLKTMLPTSTDIPGFTFDPSQDTSTVTSVPDTLTTGGPACQKFLDATEGLSTTYGTVAEADRSFQQSSGGKQIQVSILSFASPAAAGLVLADAKSAIGGCTSLAGTIGGTPTVGTLSSIPQLESATDRLGYVAYLSTGGLAVLVAAETVQVGSTIVDVELIGPQTQDTSTLQALGTSLGTVTDTVTGKVSAASAATS